MNNIIKNNKIYGSILILLSLIAASSMLQGFFSSLQYSIDMQWSPSRLIIEGKSPYDIHISGNIDGDIILSQAPNYAHIWYFLMAPLSLINFSIAKPVWASINIILSLIISYYIASFYNLEKRVMLLIILVFLASTPLRVGITNGQQSVVVMVFLILPYIINKKISYIFQGIGYSKYSFAPAFFFHNILFSGVKISLLGLALPLLGFFTFHLVTGGSILWNAVAPLHVAGDSVALGTADIFSIIEHIFGRPNFIGFVVISFFCLFLCLTGGFYSSKIKDRGLQLSVVSVISLITFKHLIYDWIFLYPVACYALSRLSSYRFDLTGFVILFAVFHFWFGIRIINLITEPFSLLFIDNLMIYFNFLIAITLMFCLFVCAMTDQRAALIRS